MLLTIERHRDIERVLRQIGCKLRTFTDSRDVTSECQCADNAQGWALLLKRDDEGHLYIDRERNEPAREIYVGSVEFVIANANGRRVLGVLTGDTVADENAAFLAALLHA